MNTVDYMNGSMSILLNNALEDKTRKITITNLAENPDAAKLNNIAQAVSNLVEEAYIHTTYTQQFIVG